MERTHPGAAVYNALTLRLYDWWVLQMSNRHAWRCPTESTLLPFFLAHLSPAHLDIGVGTGYYLQKTPDNSRISLMDMNRHSLNAAERRAGKARIHDTLPHDICEPLPPGWRGRFDSVSLFYLLHCLPGAMADKSMAVRHAAMALTGTGTLYGATILGKGVRHNAFGRKLMTVYNRKGIFCNTNDTAEDLHQGLSDIFDDVEVSMTGTVALFSARNRKCG
ncbi:TPA: class I SAM-dependent methyltransferase [Klebsiella oxytoca]|uniref:Class I SAM-dependent methyltransferase n=1 Tax=Klebsiella oxytoca TaxID=571 RepID=A0AAN5LEC8_KLEOX|nr:class I SAM-dependent methyltransferase [Klebsiella oxytoca]